VTDPALLVVQHEADTGPGWFAGWLADSGLRLDIAHPYRGELLPDLDGYEGLLVLGGAMGPADDDRCPWLPGTRALMAGAVERGLPTLGICLGGELLALACGGTVARGRQGPELGVLPFQLRPEAASDPLFSVLPPTAAVLQWHWEEIAQLPPGAVWLGASDAYPHQAFRIGAAAWGVQGHPEVTADIAAAWAREDSPLLLEAGRDPASLVAEVRNAEAMLVETWRPLAGRFASVIRERHGRGLTGTTVGTRDGGAA
jgi:GMP synthase-like glutamine amidotransferase